MKQRIPLTEGWTVSLGETTSDTIPNEAVPRHVRDALPISAEVPGTVHTDLLRAGLIDDPYLDRNELSLDWIGRQEWVWSSVVEHSPDGRRATLAFDGLDTVATVFVNGAEVLRTRNMHRRYSVDVTRHLVEGDNRLDVRVASAWAYGEAERERIGRLPNAYPAPFNYLRKSACNFGWDWGPTLVTAGIWRQAWLLLDDGARIAEVRPQVTVEGPTGAVHVDVDIDGVVEGATAELTVDGSLLSSAPLAGGTSVAVDGTVDRPRLWWPHGLGDQPLSDLTVVLRDAAGDEIDRWSSTIAFRSIRLDASPDAEGTAFVLEVNGATVPIRGANWIPDDCFLPRVDEARLRARITQAVGQNTNLLRVWGGGVYESDEFYRVCDELGVLVWQDFLFACAAYPEDPALADEVVAEARDNVARLMPHPSLVLWNGNNENIWGHEDWGWKDLLGDRPWGAWYYLDALPDVVRTVDPARPYWPGSPYSGSMEIHPNDPDHALQHIWDVWNERDWSVYRDYRPRFASEFGWQAPPTWSTLRRSVRDDPMTPTSPGVLHHQKANDGNGKLRRGLEPHLPVPQDMADWHYAMQLNQAWAVRAGVEWFRSLRPRNFGTIVWQLNDCWPVTSWATVDGDGRLKPAWYGQREAQRTRLLTIQPHDDGLDVIAVNDGGETWRESVIVRRIGFDGAEKASFTVRLIADRFGAARARIPAEVATPGDPGAELLAAETATGVRATWAFAEDRELALAPDALTATVDRDGADALVRLAASSYVRGVCVFADRIDPAAEASDQAFDLLPGETRVIRVSDVPRGRESELLDRPVLRHVGDLLARAGGVTPPVSRG
ncbi:beta-mannosidase [Frondihabitans sucicola]|uniref:beta-mannosidase n=1 Tax=Frondihabitans sucicola TaxID=1268041 RepID=A0ABM8GM12_9MICO|nr:glycoside hydrolase family 2 protein [Frondihabitans sucicola]BDZ49453.1 beta-mannosidase [Frondihabitans sucicola]